jgi:hypothetical protein
VGNLTYIRRTRKALSTTGGYGTSLQETAANRSAATITVGAMEGEIEILDDLPYMPSSTITSKEGAGRTCFGELRR